MVKNIPSSARVASASVREPLRDPEKPNYENCHSICLRFTWWELKNNCVNIEQDNCVLSEQKPTHKPLYMNIISGQFESLSGVTKLCFEFLLRASQSARSVLSTLYWPSLARPTGTV